MNSRVTSARLIGRDTELARLHDALRRGLAGQPSLVLLAGEVGVGKSRLLTEFLTGAHEAGAAVLLGACVPMVELHLPYAPVLDAMRGLVRSGSPRCPPELLGPLATDLVDLADARVAVPDQAELFRMFLTAFGRLTAGGLVVLAVEDLHWADQSTISLLGFLHRRLRGDPVIVVATYRDDELAGHPARDWLAEAARLDSTVHLPLRRFDGAAARTHLEELTGGDADPDLVEEIITRSEGNPLFAELLLGSADATIAELALRRFRWLTGAAREAVRVAAVCGPRVRHTLLQAATGMPQAELADGLSLATEYHLLVTDPAIDGYTFTHGLVREAIYADMLPALRQRWHERLTDLLLARDAPAEEVAYHAAAAGRDAEALAAAVRAGRSAAETGDRAAAYRHLLDAVAMWDRVPAAARPAGADRTDLLAEAGMAAHRLGRSAPAVALLRDAVRAVDAAREPARAALLYERLGRVDPGPDAWQPLHSGLALVPDGPRDVRATLVAGLAHVAVRRSRFADAQRYAADALALAPQGPTAAAARRALGTALVAEGRTDDGLRELRTAVEATGEGRHELDAALIRSGLPADVTGSDDPCLAAAAFAATGQWELALARLEETASGDRPTFARLVLSARLAVGQGNIRTAGQCLDRARRLLPTDGAPPRQIRQLATVAADLAAWHDTPERALSIVDSAIAAIADTGEATLAGRLYAVGLRAAADAADRARAHRVTPDLRPVQDLLDRARKLVDRPDQAAYSTLCAAEAARAHRDPAAAGYWRGARCAWDRLGRPYDAAYAGFRLAEAVVDDPGAETAEVLRTAWRHADRLGAAPLRTEIEALARASRVRLEPTAVTAGGDPANAEMCPGPRAAATGLGRGPAQVSGGPPLTRREIEVLHRLAAGDSNGDIAAALYISTKTASVHVSNILRKLGAANRRDAARTARVLGLVAA